MDSFGDDVDVSARENVRIERIYSVLAELVRPIPREGTLLKPGAHAYDLKVVAGGPHALKWVNVLLSDLPIIPIHKGMPNYCEVLGDPRVAGYLPSAFERIMTDVALPAIEFDRLLVCCELAMPNLGL